jgi:heparan-alpha-glucosaminide N-acetyltransferase
MKSRIAAIDIFRALTMLLMIIVNDLWTLHDIPAWIGHAEANADGMGLADVVFPAFLFIVGLSIPFAIKARINKGDSRAKVMLHILRRTFALVIMGFFMVNFDSFRSDISELYRNTCQVCMILAFLLVWNDYESEKVLGKIPVWLLQAIGILGLLILALFYKGGTPEDPRWMSPQWWGILGLIGWAYLLCSAIYLFAQKSSWIILVSWLGLYLLNLLEFLPLTKNLPHPLLIISASNHALVMSGVLATIMYMQTRNSGRKLLFPALLIIPAIILLTYGFAVRPLWGISKIMATPSWTAICAGISFAFFAMIYLVADVLKYTRWADFIMPAGRSALTCYLLPGLVYFIFWPLQQLLPDSFLEGWIGLLKSLLFALFIILLTGLLEKIKIRLKI